MQQNFAVEKNNYWSCTSFSIILRLNHNVVPPQLWKRYHKRIRLWQDNAIRWQMAHLMTPRIWSSKKCICFDLCFVMVREINQSKKVGIIKLKKSEYYNIIKSDSYRFPFVIKTNPLNLHHIISCWLQFIFIFWPEQTPIIRDIFCCINRKSINMKWIKK